jgi:S-disulfanyl-L-cysteine oxidoreductase SoxD
MCSWPEPLIRHARAGMALLLGMAMLGAAAAGERFVGIGRAATPAEVRAWDIDVRADFRGLPKGAGSVAKGQEVWEAKCASCHGVFGESNETFTPLVGGTKRSDIQGGRVAALRDGSFPQRTTMMKLSEVSTLWDYINRAMPWTQPKSLSVEEVYAVTAYMLHLGDVLPADFTLSDANIAQVQALLPNRNGKTREHAMWPGDAPSRRPDVQGSLCMRDCKAEPKVASLLPDFARNAHGNLAEQNRAIGPQRGADTTRAALAQPVGTPARVAAATAATAASPASAAAPAPQALLRQYACIACHGVANRIVGPSFQEIAQRQGSRSDAVAYLAGKIRGGAAGVWGSIPMPAQPAVSERDAQLLARWIAEGARAN